MILLSIIGPLHIFRIVDLNKIPWKHAALYTPNYIAHTAEQFNMIYVLHNK